MTTYYVEDYEALTGKKIPAEVEAKVVEAPPATPKKASKTQAETK